MAEPFAGWAIEATDTWAPATVGTAARRQAAARIMAHFVGTGASPGVLIDADGHPFDKAVHASGDMDRFHKRTAAEVSLFGRITEGRHVGNRKYSECGDTVGLTYSLLGCRAESIVNRDDDDLDGIADGKQPPSPDRGRLAWKVGWNLTLLIHGAKAAGCWVPASEGRLAAQGDAFIVGNDGGEHAGMWEEDPEELVPGQEWRGPTVEGGQFDGSGQCTKRYLSYLRRDGRQLILSRTRGGPGRVYVGHIDLAGLPLSAPARLPPIVVR